MEKIIALNHNLFYLPRDTIRKTNSVKYEIHTVDNVPTHTKLYRYPPMHRDEINK